MNNLEGYNIPIVFGVTGHIDIDIDEDNEIKVKEIIYNIFDEISRICPSSPFILLTPYAEGADRYVANLAKEYNRKNHGKINIIGVFPMVMEEYSNDFKSNDSKEKFKVFINQNRFFELPLVDGNTIESIKSDIKSRDLQYKQVGEYIAKHSQILIALWDGKENDSICGTYSVVKYKLTGIKSNDSSFLKQPVMTNECAPVYHIVVPRKGKRNTIDHEKTVGEPYTLKVRYANEDASYINDNSSLDYIVKSSEFDEAQNLKFINMLKNIERYNKDILFNKKYIDEKKDQEKKSFVKYAEIDENINFNEPNEVGNPYNFSESLKRTLDKYYCANALAIMYKEKHRRRLISISILTLTSVISFVAYKATDFSEILDSIIISLYIFLVFFAWILYLDSKKNDYQKKFLEYRTLAEGLRVQFMWKYAGMDENVVNVYMKKHSNKLDWIRSAINAIEVPIYGVEKYNGNMKQRFKFIQNKWISNQKDYFSMTSKINSETIIKRERICNLLFWLTIGLSFALVLCHIFELSPLKFKYINYLRQFILISLAIVAPISSMISNYINKMCFKENNVTYCEMKNIFEKYHNKFSNVLNSSDDTLDFNEEIGSYLKELIFDLGKESLAETGDWLFTLRQKQIDKPIK